MRRRGISTRCCDDGSFGDLMENFWALVVIKRSIEYTANTREKGVELRHRRGIWLCVDRGGCYRVCGDYFPLVKSNLSFDSDAPTIVSG